MEDNEYQELVIKNLTEEIQFLEDKVIHLEKEIHDLKARYQQQKRNGEMRYGYFPNVNWIDEVTTTDIASGGQFIVRYE